MLSVSVAQQGAAAASGSDLDSGPTARAVPLLVDLDTTEATVARDDVAFGPGGRPHPANPFEADVVSPYGTYRGGPATAQVIFAACANFDCGNETVDLTIGLRRSAPPASPVRCHGGLP
jgi:hypothetical protein